MSRLIVVVLVAFFASSGMAFDGEKGSDAEDPWAHKIVTVGSEQAVRSMRPTYNLGSVLEPSGRELAAMQKGPYVLHAKDDKLTKVPAEKALLPRDPKGFSQAIDIALAPDGTIFVNQQTLMCKSTDGGRTWSSYESSFGGGPNSSFEVLGDGTFVAAKAGGPQNPSQVNVFTSRDQGRTWEKISEIDNPAELPTRYADTLCRLRDGTLLLPIESQIAHSSNPAYVHRSTDGGRTWSGPKGINSGAGLLGGGCCEVMIAPMASGRLLAVIRYHGGVVPPWPVIALNAPIDWASPTRHPWYKTIFLADSEDGGKTWYNLRPLTNVVGQCHGYGLGLSDGSVIVTHDHRYPPGTPSGKAMVSYDEGRTWQDEVYYLYFGSFISGFSQSVELADGTILTVAGMNDHLPGCPLFGKSGRCGRTTYGGFHCEQRGNTDFQAVRGRLAKR